ncbi:MAG TPA: PDZ domain-containing protein [Lentibacillus sp.]|uniref:PDZ domain-containing protein n=1 Tax=Lentibacillus sp. TaxID=1925746 RepID=UPI002B4B4EE1|nr:PDZ domain-containing protein [Lentibacillus sp.]HLR62377.1 PDZ domain-containing protein [Lentibacillus sp.]
MVQTWLMELANGIGRFFLNPLVYWAIILSIVVGYKRIRKERNHFGLKIFDIFSEWKNAGRVTLIYGIVLSVITIGTGMVFSYETIMLLAAVTILLSLSMRLTLLSPVYTIGITFLLLLLAPFVLESQSLIDMDLFSAPNFTGLSLLFAIFISAEAFLLKRHNRNGTFPDMELGRRGTWIGIHHLKKMTLIPFFVLIPSGPLTSIASFWPYFSVGGETYSLMLVPFLIGFDHTVRSELPEKAAVRLAKPARMLSLIVLLLAAGSMFIGWLALAAIVAGIIGREYLNFKHRTADQKKTPFFTQNSRGIKVLAVVPGTPADRLGILVGETITKVNGKKIDRIEQFYYALQDSGAFFKLEIRGDNGEARFVQSALYEKDHHELGIITAARRYKDSQLA